MTRKSFIKDDPKLRHPNDKLPAMTANNPIAIRAIMPIEAPFESEYCTVPLERGFCVIYSFVVRSTDFSSGGVSSLVQGFPLVHDVQPAAQFTQENPLR
jgi:hypothetical protein